MNLSDVSVDVVGPLRDDHQRFQEEQLKCEGRAERMARRKRRQRTPAAAVERIGLHEAAVLLEKLREIGHVTAAHVREARTAVVREVEEITERLARLKEFAHVPASSRKPPKTVPAVVAQPALPAGKRPRKRAQAPITAQRRKIMQLQGRYMALGHQIPKSEMSKFREMIKAKGKEATVKAMETYVAKKQKK
jgi:hypothetical protein